jgi:hypothetical protein
MASYIQLNSLRQNERFFLGRSLVRRSEGAAGITYPVLMDRDHLLCELFAISNVPTVILIDENGRIARPNSVAFGNDMFIDFHNQPSEPFKDLVRQWVRTGEVDLDESELSGAVEDLSDDEIDARLHFRMAAHLRRIGNVAAEEHFAKAVELASLDFTISRASMPLTGADPFGEEFFALYERWAEAGSPFHGLGR